MNGERRRLKRHRRQLKRVSPPDREPPYLGAFVPEATFVRDVPPPPAPQVYAVSEPRAIRRLVRAAVTTAAERLPFSYGRVIQSPRRERERMRQRMEAGTIAVEPEDLRQDRATRIGELAGETLTDPISLLLPESRAASPLTRGVVETGKRVHPLLMQYWRQVLGGLWSEIAGQRASDEERERVRRITRWGR